VLLVAVGWLRKHVTLVMLLLKKDRARDNASRLHLPPPSILLSG
jgi:hypothetical protein